MNIINTNKSHLLIISIIIFSLLALTSCGRKSAPLPQKINQLFSFQNVYVYADDVGTITVMGEISGAKQNVQALELQLEGYDETCPTCPFLPVESFSIRPADKWPSGIPNNFSFTIMPTKQFKSYRWRLVGYNHISGLPEVLTPVLKLEAPIEDNREFVEIYVDKE